MCVESIRKEVPGVRVLSEAVVVLRDTSNLNLTKKKSHELRAGGAYQSRLKPGSQCLVRTAAELGKPRHCFGVEKACVRTSELKGTVPVGRQWQKPVPGFWCWFIPKVKTIPALEDVGITVYRIRRGKRSWLKTCVQKVKIIIWRRWAVWWHPFQSMNLFCWSHSGSLKSQERKERNPASQVGFFISPWVLI